MEFIIHDILTLSPQLRFCEKIVMGFDFDYFCHNRKHAGEQCFQILRNVKSATCSTSSYSAVSSVRHFILQTKSMEMWVLWKRNSIICHRTRSWNLNVICHLIFCHSAEWQVKYVFWWLIQNVQVKISNKMCTLRANRGLDSVYSLLRLENWVGEGIDTDNEYQFTVHVFPLHFCFFFARRAQNIKRDQNRVKNKQW